MTDTAVQDLKDVAETLYITLYVRAQEAQRPDALIKDEKAAALVDRLKYDFSQIKEIRLDDGDKVSLVLRNLQYDHYARDFLARNPDGVVVHIGCGLDSRFERVDNGRVEWYDLDLPQVIALRKKYLGGESGRYHQLATSAFDLAWLDGLCALRPRPFLFLAEGVFMYFEEAQVRSLALRIRECFPGAELAFDVLSPLMVRLNNLRFTLTHYGARYHCPVRRGQDVEKWSPGIRLLGEWSYFDSPEPRLDSYRWMRRIPLFARVLVIYRFLL